MSYFIKRIDTGEYLVSGSRNSEYQYWDKYKGFAFSYFNKAQANKVINTIPRNIPCEVIYEEDELYPFKDTGELYPNKDVYKEKI